MTFIFTLLIVTLSLSGIFAFLTLIARKKSLEGKSLFVLSQLEPRYNLMIAIHASMLTAFVAVSILSASWIPRPYYYFGIEATLFASGMLIASLNGRRTREYLLVLTIAVVSISNYATVIIGNGGIPVGTDQYRDVLIANSISAGSEFRNVQLLSAKFSGYYALIPALPTSLSILSSVTDLQPYISFPILGGAVSLAFALGIFLAIKKFTNDALAAWVAAFVALSTPRLVSLYTVPESVSMAIIAAAFVILFIRLGKKSLQKTDIKYFAIMIFLVLASIVYHPSGGVTMIFLLVPLLLVTLIALKPQLNYRIRALSIICVFVSLIYWSYNDLALSTITNTNARLFNSLLSAYEEGSYTPPTLVGTDDAFTFSWALPVAISLALLVVFTRKMTQKQSEIFGGNRIAIAQTAAVVALPLTFIGFVSFLFAPGAAVERYMSVTTYFLMLIPVALFAGPILRSLKAPYVVAVIAIICVSVVIGSYSPEFAPSEHRSFEAARPTLDAYLELSPVQNLFPGQSYVYADNDIPLADYLESSTLNIQHPQSFQRTRNILGQLGSGELDTFDAVGGKITILMVKSDRMEADPSIYKDMNLIGSTGNHMIFVIERK